MKTTLLQIIVVAAFLTQALASKIPEHIEIKMQAVLKQLHDTSSAGEYGTDRFIRDLKQIEATDDLLRKMRNSPEVDPLKLEMLELALAVRRPEVITMINELRGWYGCYAHELPEEFFQIRWQYMGKNGRPTLKEHREFMREQVKLSRFPGRVEHLRDEHVGIAYLPAWKFWLMAPPSKERGIMLNRITQALSKIGNESAIPMLLESMKIEVGRVRSGHKKSVAETFINLIARLPGEVALDALLAINRYAVANDLNGDDYYKSITRHIIRCLASRRAYADQLIDPKMKELLARKGNNEKPEDIPLTDELWKKYKPLLEARLAAKTDKTPQADIELIKSALEIMPKS